MQYPSAPSIGYSQSLDALKGRNVRGIALAGDRGLEFILQWQSGSLPFGLPAEIVFLSPTFSPVEIPDELRQAAKVRYVIGEFAARYFADCAAGNEDWITKVRGAEVYIPGWLGYVMLNISDNP